MPQVWPVAPAGGHRPDQENYNLGPNLRTGPSYSNLGAFPEIWWGIYAQWRGKCVIHVDFLRPSKQSLNPSSF